MNALEVAISLNKRDHVRLLVAKGANLDRLYRTKDGQAQSTIRQIIARDFPEIRL